MIIDCHVHIAPDRIARAVQEVTERNFGKLAGPITIGGVLQSMEAHGISVSVVFNVAQRPDLVKAANDFVIGIADNKRIVGLGTIHPELDERAEEVARLRAGGLKGIKFHALVQKFGAGDPRLDPVYEAMGGDMIAYLHCGKNPHDASEPVLNTPAVIASLHRRFPKLKIVAAHFGGMGMLDEAKEHVIGKDIYVDTSWGPGSEVLDAAAMAEVIRTHGVERVLFGTDYPTVTGVRQQIDWVRSLPLSDAEKEMVFSRNALELFNLS